MDGELEDIRLVFCCLLQCERARCRTVVAVSGTGDVHENQDYEDDERHLEWNTQFCHLRRGDTIARLSTRLKAKRVGLKMRLLD